MLVLAEFTGAARELTDAVLVNPFDVDEMAEAIRARADDDARRAAEPDARGCASRCATTTSTAGPVSCSASSPACPARPISPTDPASGLGSRRDTVRLRLTLDPALRQLLRNAGWLLLSDGTVLVAGLLGTLVAARALGAQEFGRITLVWSVVGVAHLLVDVRAWEAVTRYLSEFTSRRQPALALATLKLAVLAEGAVALLGFGLIWLASGWVSTRLFNDPSLQPLILLGAVTLVVSAFDRTARAVLRVFDRFGALGLCSAIEAVLSLFLVILAVAVGGRAKGVLVAHLAAAAAGAILLLAVAAREVRARLWAARASARLSAVSRYRHEMLAFVGHSAVRASLKVLTRRFDLILLGYFRSPAEVGTYGAALRLAQVMEEISDPLYFAAFPQLARAWVEARDEFFRLLRAMAAGLAVLTSAVVAVGAVAAPFIVALALGPTYAAAARTLASPSFRHRRRSRDALGHAGDARERAPRGGDDGRDGRGRGPRRPARGSRADLGNRGSRLGARRRRARVSGRGPAVARPRQAPDAS